MPRTYEPIASQTLGTASASVEFTSISGSFTDLVLVMYATTTADDTNGRLTFNSTGGTSYSHTNLEGTGSAASSGRGSNLESIRFTNNTGFDDTNPSVSIFQIMSYANTNVFKTVLHSSADFNSTYPGVTRRVGLFRSTSAITSVKVETTGSTFKSGSTFSLYGIKAA
jgi:hypothetical protein